MTGEESIREDISKAIEYVREISDELSTLPPDKQYQRLLAFASIISYAAKDFDPEEAELFEGMVVGIVGALHSSLDHGDDELRNSRGK